MSDSEEWGPWIEHDGAHKPELGAMVEREYANGLIITMRMGDWTTTAKLGISMYRGPCFSSGWMWADGMIGNCIPVVRYRIRKPRGMAILEQIARDVTTPIKETEA